ncbi:MAG: phosphate ABC transporter permease, partial [Gammaproteobacteria bacterium]
MTQPEVSANGVLPDFYSAAAVRLRHWRHIKDVAMRYVMAVGGVSVIIAILLIAFYLLYVVVPMFRPARLEQISAYPVPAGTDTGTLYYALEEQHEIGMRVTSSGSAVFFRTADGSLVHHKLLTENTLADVTAFATGDPSQSIFALGLSDGGVILARHEYEVTYPQDQRVINPRISYPYGAEPLEVDPFHQPIRLLAVQSDEDQATIAALTEDARLLLVNLKETKSFLSDDVETTRTDSEIAIPNRVKHLVLDVEQRELYAADDQGFIYFFDTSNKEQPRLIQRVTAVTKGVRITSLQFLSGGISILVGDSSGQIAQWFPVRDDENNYTLEKIRFFDSQNAPITALAPEFFRKGFLAADVDGYLGIYHTTAHRTVKLKQVEQTELVRLAVSPRADAVLIETKAGQSQFWHV